MESRSRNLDVPPAPLLFSQRWVLAILALLGNMFVYIVRANLSVAIICMVRSDDVTFNNLTSSVYNVTESPKTSDDGCEGLLNAIAGPSSNDRGEFNWDKSTRSTLLAMYFYGYIFTQIPGGWIASRYGGKRIWGVCMFISALCTLVTPISVRTSVHLAYAVRFILGFSAGVTFPCVHALLGRWTPPFERSKLAVYTFGGPIIGSLLTFSISGYMCEYGFDNGWGSIFYLGGIFNMIWVVVWFLVVADTPDKHSRIKPRELNYIKQSIGKGNVEKVRQVPWRQMFRSGPLWAVIIAHAGSNYTNYTLLTSLPAFMKESLKFDIKQNGLLSSLPYVSQLLSSIVVAFVADTVRQKRWMSTTRVRKIAQCTGFFGMAVCIAAVGQMDCSHRNVAVFLLCLCTGFMGFGRAGCSVNHLDLASSYAGVLFGITNTVATIPGMVAPLVAASLTPNKTPEEWRNVFYVCSAIAAASGIVYAIMADGELQVWANPEFFKETQVEIIYKEVNSVDLHGGDEAREREATLDEKDSLKDETMIRNGGKNE